MVVGAAGPHPDTPQDEALIFPGARQCCQLTAHANFGEEIAFPEGAPHPAQVDPGGHQHPISPLWKRV